MSHYDAIVVGTGGVGSAALWHLARRGARVLGLDRFPPAHDRGSSHGQTRIIRQAYLEHADYVPLVLRAYKLWAELSQQLGRELYCETGLLEIGPPDGMVVKGVCRAAQQHGLEVERLTASEIRRRWSGLEITPEQVGVFEQQAGYLWVEACVQAHLEAAQAAGAELRTGVAVHGWAAHGQSIEVATDAGVVTADRLVLAAGAWASELLGDLGVRLEVRRKPVFWFRSDDVRYAAASGFPPFLFELPEGVFYGVPQLDDNGVKVAEHTGGERVADPLQVDRTLRAEDEQRIVQFLAAHLPGVSRHCTTHSVCMYTMSPDEHFIVDRHPDYESVVFAAGLSGHGFKFTPVLGEVLADLALSGTATQPIGFLSLDRPGLRPVK